ncbi:hypothetical protein [Flavobacterium sp.]|uniref:hypothetical protein n=1 Tax=Flavobacterium sp. TaxID=239 RepID=UPI0025BE4007|nr:hypothetical protein [Flavobacterium sp.]
MRTIFILLTFLGTMLSCKNSENRAFSETESQKDSILYKSSDKNYTASYGSNSRLYLTNRKNDTLINIMEEGVAPNSIKFEDFDGDGNNDLKYGFSSNYYYEKVWLYNQKEKSFRVIDSIDNPEFAYSKKLENSNFYYSFSPNGCGKNNWISFLFSIENFKIKPKGFLEYRQCVDDEKGMYVYKIANGKKVLVEKVNLKEADQKDLNQNWKKFINKIASP